MLARNFCIHRFTKKNLQQTAHWRRQSKVRQSLNTTMLYRGIAWRYIGYIVATTGVQRVSVHTVYIVYSVQHVSAENAQQRVSPLVTDGFSRITECLCGW